MPSPAIPPPRTSCASSSPDHPQTLRPAARRFCFPPPSASFRWRRLRRRRVSKDSPPGESLRLAVPVPPPAAFSLCPQFLPLPASSVGAGSAGAAYPEIRRKANLPAQPYPFRLPPSFSLCPQFLPLPATFASGAKRRHVSRDSPQGESFRFGWGGLSRRGLAPSLTPRLPSHAPPFPQPQSALGGGCREGAPLPTSHRARRLCRRARGDFRIATDPPVPPCSRPTPQPFRQPWHSGNRFLSAPRRVRGEAECAPGPTGPGPKKRETTLVVSLFFGKRAPPGNGPSSVSGTARQRVISQECPPARSGACPRGASWRAPYRSPPPQCGS